MASTSTRRAALLAALLAAGGLLRLREAAKPADLRALWLGQWEYYGLGVQLARAGDYAFFPGLPPTAFRLPLYPAFIAAAARLSPGLSSLRLAQAALDTAAIGGVYLLGAAAGGPLPGLGAAAAYALSPARAAQASEVAIEPFLGALVILAALGLCWWARRWDDARRAAAAGAAVGLSLFCRSTLALFPPALALLLCARRAGFWRSRALAVFLLAAYAPLLPWAWRNHRVFGAFVPLEQGAAAVNVWGASVGAVRAVSDVQSGELSRGLYADVHAEPDWVRSERLLAAARENVAARPFAYAWSCLRRLPLFWSEQWPWLLLCAGLLSGAPLGPEASALLLLAAYFNVHALMAVHPRYARPIAGPLLALAACGAAALLRRAGAKARPGGKAAADALLRRSLAGGLASLAALYAFATGLLLRDASRYPRGLGAVPRAYEASPALYESLKDEHDRAVASAVRGDWEGAERGFDAVLARRPDFGESLISRAVARDRLGAPAAAETDYREALRLLEEGPKEEVSYAQ